MYLDRILGTRTKVNIIATLVHNPKRSYVEKELASECGASLSETNRQITDLVNSGLIIMQRMGRTKIYRLNASHFLYLSLKRLFVDLNKVFRRVADWLTAEASKKHSIKCVFLVGSVATGTVRSDLVKEPSDIDLVFIVQSPKEVQPLKKTLIHLISSEVASRYGIVLYPLVLGLSEYQTLLDKGTDSFILHVQAHGEVLYGSKP